MALTAVRLTGGCFIGPALRRAGAIGHVGWAEGAGAS